MTCVIVDEVPGARTGTNGNSMTLMATIRLDGGTANRVLLALERLEQDDRLDPVLGDLRYAVKYALQDKSSGDTDSAPSSGNAAST